MEYSLTNPQNSIWLTEKFYQNTPINNISGYTYISEVVDFDVLTQAINEVIKTNDAMRIKIKEENDKCVQYISEYIPFSIEIINLSSENDIEKKSLELAKIPFNVEENTLFKFTFFKLPNQYGGFFLTAHHIISDSWSLGLVVKQIMLNYCNIKNNTFSSKEHPSYVSYINDEKRYLESSKFLKDKEYWNDIFKTVPEIATIPSFKNVTNASSGNRSTFTFDIKLVKKINDFCKANNISLYNFFMAVYSLYLGRVSNLDDFVIGTPILNRTNFEQKNTVGMFISTTPLRVNLNHELTFVDFIKDISARTISLFRHQRYPYQYILEDLRKKDSSIPNLYNVVLSYQITKTFDEESGINYSAHWLTNGCCSDDLQIHLLDLNNEGSLHVAYDYRTDKYTEQDIADLHARILTIINQVMSNNDIVLKNIEIVTPEEKHKILYEFNNTRVDYPKNKTIVDLFEEQVNKTPDNIAVVFEDQKLTYRELNEKANQLARYLISNGAKKGDIIGVYMPKGLNLIISIFSILKCGAVYMPMCVEYPKDRLKYMVNNSDAKFVISENNSDFSNCNNININCFDFLSFDTKNLINNNILLPVNLAYIIYTSGSTGNPKGVKISHRNLINFIYAFNKYYNNEISSHDSFLVSTNIAFDVSIWEIFMPLLNGAHLIFNTEEIINNISLYTNNIIKNNITAMYIPPNILDETFTILNDKKYTKLSKLLVGVESITNTTLNKYIKLNPKIQIVNGYGPTETTICATAFKYTFDTTPTHIVPIGNPIYNNKAYIISGNSLCPINTPGELYVSGDGVGQGYLNNIEKTNSSFTSDPFFLDNIMYNTGDLAYWDNNGCLHFLGRKDNQIKLHGYRIELSEIDSKLNSYPDIKKAFSIVKDNNIISYYLSTDKINSTILKSHLSESLPFYMIPTFFIKLSALPLTQNGKIDKKKLPLPQVNSSTYAAPTTQTEKLLCQIWKNLFNKDNIGINDNFFEIGGDSLTAIKFQTEALKYNMDISYSDIFSSPTIKELASLKSNNLFTVDNNYNYNTINNILSINTLNNLSSKYYIDEHSSILLLGSTGFLGAHILDNILTNTSSKVFCLIRNKNNLTGVERLSKILNYYFGNKYEKLFGTRIIVLDGDITKKNLGLDLKSFNVVNKSVSCVLNSAALVKHYGNINDFNNINIGGTKNIINFCMTNSKKLYHVSTISVSGLTNYYNSNKNDILFKETNLYIKQNLNNAYIYTKFQAEVLILEAIAKGLNATILRLGNISNRYSDGKFQINFSDNAYLNRLKSFIAMGMLPDSFVNHAIDFSPVDFCADAIVKIVFSKNNFTVFHLFNTNLVKFSDIISFLNKLGYNIQFVNNSMFKIKLSSMLDNQNEKEKISGIIPDLDSNKNLNLIFDIVPNADFSTKFLKKLDFNWPLIDINYFERLILYFKNIGYFN